MASALSRYSDEELFRAFRAGGDATRDAFMEIYARYSQKVYLFALRLSGSPDDADDIFQRNL